MLNPSTADATQDDPTIRCCIRLASREGFGGFWVVNLFAYRTPDRKQLAHVIDPIGPDNDHHLRTIARRVPVCILAWGGVVPIPDRTDEVLKILQSSRTLLKCLEMIGPSGARQPRHPLYLRKSARLIDFPTRFMSPET